MCAHCGYAIDGEFRGDMCPQRGLTHWKCGTCGFQLTGSLPPDACPECRQKSSFKNVTWSSIPAPLVNRLVFCEGIAVDGRHQSIRVYPDFNRVYTP
ncbi:MAG: hypothetical protein WBR24_07725 [Desulfobacterales bacterium]